MELRPKAADPQYGEFLSCPTMLGVPKQLYGIFAMLKTKYNEMFYFIDTKANALWFMQDAIYTRIALDLKGPA